MAEEKKGLLGRLGFGRRKKDAPPAPPPPPPAPAKPVAEAPRDLTPAERALEEARALAREREAQGIDAVEEARRLAAERDAAAKAEAERMAAEEARAAREAEQAEINARTREQYEASLRREQEREAAEAEEAARIEAERLAAEKQAAAEAEAARVAAERAEAERAAEETRLAEEAEAKRIAQEAEAAKAKAAEDAARVKAEAEAEAARVAEAERAEAERVAAEEAARLKAEKDAAAKAAAEAKAAEEREAREAAERERLEAERLEAERRAAVEAEKAEAARIAKRKAEAQEADRLAKEKAKSEKAAREAAKREKAKAEKLAAEQAKREAEAKAKAESEAKARADAEAAERAARDAAEREAREAAERERLKAEAQAKLDAAKAKPAAAARTPLDPEREGGIFARMSKGLKRSSSKLSDNVVGAFQKRLLDDEALEDLEDMLIASDLGVRPSLAIVERLQDQRFNTTVDDSEVREAMAEVVADTLQPFEKHLKLAHEPGSGHLEVVLFTGVNGSGKTTTLGKLAAIFRDAGYTILIAAADTFRAAANEQLAIWAERAEAPIMEGKQGADAAGLVFDAMTRAREDGYDILMVDTAGRLQNRTELMDELEKIVRVIRKQDPSAPHHSLLVLDATVGQNALSQVEVFKETADVTGLVMTKLDGTAKGGVLVNLTDTHKLPIHFVGIGERLEDLETFDARAYAKALSGSV